MCAKPRRKPKAKPQPKDDLFGTIPSMPEFNAFPDDIISQLTTPASASGKPEGEAAAKSAPDSPADNKRPAGKPGAKKGRAKAVAESGKAKPTVEPGVQKRAKIRQSVKGEPGDSASAARAAKTDDAVAVPVAGMPSSASGTRVGRPVEQLEPTDDSSVGADGYADRIAPPSPVRTRNQVLLRDYLLANGNHITTYQIISQETGVPVGTIRDVFRKFEALALIEKHKVVKKGGQQGMRLTVLSNLRVQQSPPRVGFKRGGVGKKRSAASGAASALRDAAGPGCAANTPVDVDARNRLSALTDEDMGLFYPNLAGLGFTRAHLDKVLANLEKLGKAVHNLFQAMEYADWEASGKGGNVPGLEDVFAAMSRTGCYPRPEGYVPPEVQAALDRQKDEQVLAGMESRPTKK